MTAEDVDVDISTAFDKLALTQHWQPLNYLCDDKPIILKAIKEIRLKKKCSDVHSIYDYITNTAASNVAKISVQNLIDNLIQKDEIFNRKICQGFDSLYIRSNNKLTPLVNVDKPVNVKTPEKNINIIFLKTVTNLDKSAPNCDIVTGTPALKDKSGSKLNSSISKNVLKSPDSSTLLYTLESHKSIHKVSPATDQKSAFCCNDDVRNEVLDTFYED